MQITINGATTMLALPRSATIRWELAAAVRDGEVSLRTAAAAVGICWPSGAAKPPSRYRGDVADYGARVADELLERGAKVSDIVSAGAACIEAILTDGLVGLSEAKEAADPTGAPAEGSP
jgi:hypothetical protein